MATNSNSCPECHSKKCGCFITGTSIVYEKAVREACEAQGLPQPNTGYPSHDWAIVVDMLGR